MNVSIQLYILSILISLYVAPSLPKIIFDNTTETLKDLLWYMNIYRHDIVWTGTVIKYTKWAAFIGCGRSFSPLDFGRSVKTVEDCLKPCSDYSSATYFVVKSSTCYCIVDKPEINGDTNDCRRECANATYTPCRSDFNKETSNTYIKKECIITTNKNKTRFAVSDCNAKHLYGCTNTSCKVFTINRKFKAKFIPKSCYDYQEICLKWGYYVMYNRNTIGGAYANKLWTPIFRSHTVVTGKLSGKDLCLALSTRGSNHFTVKHCSFEFPFICSRSLAIAVILFVIFLLFLIVIISIKSFRRIRIYQEKLKRVNEMFPGTEFSNYTGIEDTNEEANDFGYIELSDNVSQLRSNRHDIEMDKSEDSVEYQGYQLVPEQHYHTIPKEEIHYAAADEEERNSDKTSFDRDDYLEPVI